MRRIVTAAGLGLFLAGCGGKPEPEVAPVPTRAPCDSYAAQAIQAQDLAVATTLAAQASECYANLRAGR